MFLFNMKAKCLLLSTYLLMILPKTLQSPIQFRGVEDYDDDNRISFPRMREAVNVPLNEEYLDDQSEDDIGDEDDRALYEFVSELKEKGDNAKTGARTWKPDLESNDLWDFKSFLDELVTQSRNKLPRIRMPDN